MIGQDVCKYRIRGTQGVNPETKDRCADPSHACKRNGHMHVASGAGNSSTG